MKTLFYKRNLTVTGKRSTAIVIPADIVRQLDLKFAKKLKIYVKRGKIIMSKS